MKNTIYIILCITILIPNAYAELTQSDLDKIRLIVKDEVEIAIDKSEKRMKHYVDYKVGSLESRLDAKINSVNSNLGSRIDSVEIGIKSLEKLGNRNFQLILALVGFITVVVGIPQIIVIFQNKQFNSMLEEIESIKKLVENSKNE